MKKILKIIVIIIIVILVLIGGIFGYGKVRQITNDNERRNSKNLMEYVKTHRYDYLNCQSGKECLDMHFEENKFVCNIDYNDIINFQNDYFITKDYEIYDVSFEKLFSNNQNCKKKEFNIDILYIRDNYIFSKDNKIYDVNTLEERQLFDFAQIYLLDKDIIQIINSDYDNEIIKVLVYKNNNIYKQTYNIANGPTGANKITFKNEELFKSLEEYGNIRYITFGTLLETDNGYIDLGENSITKILSDKGYYYLGEIKTEECTKYKDIECKIELNESEIYKKFSKDIKYVGEQYTILSDNSVIRTEYLTYPLDKDLNK